MAIRIAGARNPENQVDFEVELDDGSVLEFTVPKVEYLPEPVMEEYEPWLEEWEKKVKASTKASAADRKKMRTYDPMLKLLELLLPAETYSKVTGLARGVLIDIDNQWLKASGVKVGESGASARS